MAVVAKLEARREARRREGAARSVAPRVTVKEFLRRFDLAEQNAVNWRSIHEDAYRYAMPNRNLYTTQQQGAKKNDVAFDSTAIHGTIAGASRLKQDLMPSFKKFLKLAPGPLVPEHLREAVAAELDEVTDKMFAFVHASNFDTSCDETLLDLFVGTGCMLVLEGDPGIAVFNHVAVPLSQVSLEEGPWGGVSGIYRKHKMAVRNVRRQWPEIKATDLPASWQTMMRDKPETEVTLKEGTYFAVAKDGSGASTWHYDVVACADREEARLVERSYDVNPWVTPRWYKLAGEVFGRGPIILALPDIKVLNKIVELILRNLALYVSGVYTGVDDGVLNPNTAAIVPGAIIPVASNGGGTRGPSLAALERSGSFDLGKIEIEELRTTVKRFLFDRSLPPDAGAVRSATEIIERVKELAREVGAPFGRLHSELIVPLVRNWLEIMRRRGLIPAGIDVDGLGITVQVVSPLAQEQNLSDVEIVVRFMTILSSFGSEMMMMGAKTEDLPAWIGEKLGVPSKLLRNTQERKQVMDDIKKMAANEMAKAGGSNTIPLGVGVAPYQATRTSAAAAGVAPFSKLAA